MITSKDKLKLICNYKEETSKKINQPINISFTSMISTDDEEYILEQKKKNRDLKIDVITGEKDSSVLEKVEAISEYDNFPIISPQFHSIIMKPNKFVSYDDIYDDTIQFLEKNTQNPKKINAIWKTNLNITLVNYPNYTLRENFDLKVRKILTNIMLNSSVIATDGRYGPAKTILYGENLIEYFDQIKSMVQTFDYIYEPNLDPDKVILCRNSSTLDQEGIVFVDNSTHVIYFMKETPKWNKQYSWFLIK